MANKDFTTAIEMGKSPKDVFNAINDVSSWWQGEINGNSNKLGDEFAYRMKEFHFSKQKVVEFIPYQKIVWLITECKLNFIKDKNEWTGTKIIFEITEINKKTQLRLTHQGLVPDIECYGACSNAWTQLIKKSLFSFI